MPKQKAPLIYPIYLSAHRAESLVSTYANDEFQEHSRFNSRNQYSFSAQIEANGDVRLSVRYSFDSGFCSGGGTAFTKNIRPYDDDQLKHFKLGQMVTIAKAELESRENQKRFEETLAIARELFGKDFDN